MRLDQCVGAHGFHPGPFQGTDHAGAEYDLPGIGQVHGPAGARAIAAT